MPQEYLDWHCTDENGTAVDVSEDPTDAPGAVGIRLEDAHYRQLSAWIPAPAVRALRDALTGWLDRQVSA